MNLLGGSILKFTKKYRKMRVSFTVYADFECLTIPITSCEMSNEKPFTQQYQQHIQSEFAFKVKSFDEKSSKSSFISYTAKKENEDASKKICTNS